MRKNYVSPRDLMSIHNKIIQDSELGDYQQYIIGVKTNDFWRTLSLDIIKDDQIKRTKPIDPRISKQRYSNFKTQSQDSSAFQTQQKQPSSNNLPALFFQESEQIVNQKIKVKINHNQKWNIKYHYFRNESRTMRIATIDARNRQDGEILYADNQNQINIQGFRRKSCICSIEGQIGSKLKRLGNFQTEVQFHKRKKLANILIDNLSQTRRTSTFGKHQIKATRQKRGLIKGTNNIVQMPQLVRSSSFEDDSSNTVPHTLKNSFEGGSLIVIQNPSRFSLDDYSLMKINIPSKFSSQTSIRIRSDSRLLTIQNPVVKPNKNIIHYLLEEEDEIVQFQSVPLIKVVSLKKLSEAQKNLYYPRPKQMQRKYFNVSSFHSQHTSYYTRGNQQNMLPNITKKKNLSQRHLNTQPQKVSGIYTNISNRKSLFQRNFLSLNNVKQI